MSHRPAPAALAACSVPLASLVLLGWPFGAGVGLALAPAVYGAVGRLESAASRERGARLSAQLPGALDLVAATLEVGRPPVVALGLAADATTDPLGSELGQLASRLAVAGDPVGVWTSLLHDPALAPVGRAFRRAERSGMPVAQVILGVADELRRERRARRRDDSRKVAVRTAAPLGVCFLPAFFLIGIVPTIMSAFHSFTF
ncbi:MAG: type II secretion system F family protein [Aeromicrobium sp.]